MSDDLKILERINEFLEKLINKRNKSLNLLSMIIFIHIMFITPINVFYQTSHNVSTY